MKFSNLSLMKFILFTFTLSVFILSCTAKESLTYGDRPTISSIPSYQFTPTFSTLATESSRQAFENIVTNDDYLKDCKLKYPQIYNQQVGFQEVYSGITTESELIDRLGRSYEISKSNEGTEYFYSDSNMARVYSFFVINNLVDDIAVVADSETLIPLQKILEKYGCPDLIIAIALSDDLFERPLDYNRTFLVYLDGGVQIRFEGYPINYSDVPSLVRFTKPSSLSTFLEIESDYATGFLVSDSSMPVSLLEAVK